MSATTAATIIAGLLTLALLAGIWQTRRTARRESIRNRLIREAQQGAEATREIDELELIYAMPEFEAGLNRLRQAIRDEQQKGDQA